MKKILTVLIIVAILIMPLTMFNSSAKSVTAGDEKVSYISVLCQKIKASILSLFRFDFGKDAEKDENDNIDTISEEADKAEAPADTAKKDEKTTKEEKKETKAPEKKETEPKKEDKKETPTNSSVQAIEVEIVKLVNQERAKRGLSALKLNEKLSDVARLKSKDMSEKKYFSHTSPTYGSPFDMMKKFGISYRTAGENIAQGYTTAQAVVNAWMNSEGHRANILNANFKEIGVGYYANGNYFTQMFIG